MSTLTDILLYLQTITMRTPRAWGRFHMLWLTITAVTVVLFLYLKRKKVAVPPNLVFGLYGFTTLALEITKQLMWSVSQGESGVTWAYSWYAAPFQYCTMPMYLTIALCFIRREKIREYLCAFLAFFSIISMTLVMMIPNSIFTGATLINIHTCFLHFGGFAVAMFVLINRLIPWNMASIRKGAAVFLALTAAALAMDVGVQLSGINHGAAFNMFYISPYFECSLPVLHEIKNAVAYPLFLLIYVVGMIFGSLIVLAMARGSESLSAELHRMHQALGKYAAHRMREKTIR